MPSRDLRHHFLRFRRGQPHRIHLAPHSHHYWPDVCFEAQMRAFDDAARFADLKWNVVFGEVIPAVQAGVARILSLPDPSTLVFAPNTHDFLRRLMSCAPTGRPARVLTSDGEFHTAGRQFARWEEAGLATFERVATEPFDSFPARLHAAAARGRHDLVFVSEVLFGSAATVGDLAALVAAVPSPETLIAIDGYHAFMARPTDLSALADRVFYMAGGYKYAMAGEGVCFMHCPPGIAPRPVDTGWFAGFGDLSAAPGDGVGYPQDAMRFAGATFDPTGLYRLRAVLDWMADLDLEVSRIHAHARKLGELFVAALEPHRLPGLMRRDLITPFAPDVPRGNFLVFRSPHAGAIRERLERALIITDNRGDGLRIGFACYHTEADIEAAVAGIVRALDL